MVHIASIVLPSLYLHSAKLHKCTVATSSLIIELIDLICRDSMGTQYMIIENKFSKAVNILYNSVPLIFECFHNRQHAQCMVQKEEERKTFWPSGDFLVWYFCNAFLFRLASSIFSSSAPVHRVFTWKAHKVVQTCHWRTMASFVTPFSSLHW